MVTQAEQQISNQNASTTVWSQPSTEEQKRYFSKHAPKRKVYGWIMTVLQAAHGFLAFAAWTAVYAWVFKSLTDYQFLAPILAIGSLFALHVLFRTTWTTYWYDKLDNDPNTDSTFLIPLAIFALLLLTEVNGAKMYLTNQVKPVERIDASPIESTHSSNIASVEQSYENDKARIEQLYKGKEKSLITPINRQIWIATKNEKPTASLINKREKLSAELSAAKASELEKAFQQFRTEKESALSRKEMALNEVDSHNARENTRYLTEMGNTQANAWIISIALIVLIAALGYARVRINVKSGILPLRNYTVLDAHGNVLERFSTAFSDIFNRRSLQLAVFIHRVFSPKKELTSFDGTVVAKPGTYNTPAGFFPNNQSHQNLPQASNEEDVLRSKVFQKVMSEAGEAGITVTKDLLESELEKAKRLNGTYFSTPLGKVEPSPEPATGEGKHSAGQELTLDQALKAWAKRVQTQVDGYDRAILAGDSGRAKSHENYINSGPIQMEASRLGIDFGVFSDQPEILVWFKRTPGVKVPLSKVSETALSRPIASEDDFPEAGEAEELFKQDVDLFKQTIQPQVDSNGVVIGVKYRKKSGEWVSYPKPQVEAFAKTYKERASKKPSDATQNGADKWEYALSLFKTPDKRELEEVEAIRL